MAKVTLELDTNDLADNHMLEKLFSSRKLESVVAEPVPVLAVTEGAGAIAVTLPPVTSVGEEPPRSRKGKKKEDVDELPVAPTAPVAPANKDLEALRQEYHRSLMKRLVDVITSARPGVDTDLINRIGGSVGVTGGFSGLKNATLEQLEGFERAWDATLASLPV